MYFYGRLFWPYLHRRLIIHHCLILFSFHTIISVYLLFVCSPGCVHGPHQQYHHPLGHAGAGIGMGQGMAGQQLLQYGGQQQPFVSAGHTGTVPGAG